LGDDVSIYITSLPKYIVRERVSRGEVSGMLLCGQAERKQAEILARKSSNQKWRNALNGACGNNCPRRRPVVF